MMIFMMFFIGPALRLAITLSIYNCIQVSHLPVQANDPIRRLNEMVTKMLSCSYKGAVNSFSKDEEICLKIGLKQFLFLQKTYP